jgi:orotate phosphoribosyltransferase-like protein
MSRWLSKEQQARIEALVLKAHSQGLTNSQIILRENLNHERVAYILLKNKLKPNKEYSMNQVDLRINSSIDKFKSIGYIEGKFL